jgi:PAS domain S-box-containing protein
MDMIQVFEAVRNDQGQIIDFIWILNNQAAEKIYGDVVGKSLLQRQPGVVEAGIFEAFTQVVETGEPQHYEKQYVHEPFDGWFLQSVVRLNDGVTTTTADITTRKQAETEILRLNEAVAQNATSKYQILVNAIYQGFALGELVRDQQGQGVDHRILELNPAFEQQTGISLNAQLGRTAREAFPTIDPWWSETYTKLVDSAEPMAFEHYFQEVGRWYEIGAYPLQGDQFAVLYNDITERKQQEERQHYQLKLNEALRTLSSPDELLGQALTLVGKYLDLDRVTYNEIDPAVTRYTVRANYVREGFSPNVGVHPMDPFHQTVQNLHRGQTFVVNDAQDESFSPAEKAVHRQMQVGAYVTVPLVKNGRWLCNLVAHVRQPRPWTVHEVTLLEETAERIWAAVERAKAEEALLASQKRFASIANLVPDLLWDSGPNGTTNWYNQRWLEYTGQRFEEAIGWGWTDAIHPDDREGSLRHYREAVAAGQAWRQEHRIRRYDGVYRWFIVSTFPLKDQQGQVVSTYGAATDIHESKLAEVALQESEKRWRLAIEATELATWEWHLDTDQVYWNEQHFRLFNMEPRPNPLSPDEFMRHVHPREQTRVNELLARAIAERGVYEAEFCAVLEDGSQRWMSGYGRITEERAGQPVRMSGVMFDVDKRRRAEDALRLADQRKDEFLAMLAHELRNPLAPIRNGLQFLAQTHAQDQTLRTLLPVMNRQMDHLMRLVDDLLDVSRISRGQIQLHRQGLDLVHVVDQTVRAMQPLYTASGRRLEAQLPDSPLYVNGDGTRLHQVVANLLSNGLRYTSPGGQVWLRLERLGEQAVLRVSDNGIGLAADQLDAIFKLFVRVDTSLARSQGGLGVGLALVQQLVELHGGRVEAHSPGLEQGSAFIVYLPILLL